MIQLKITGLYASILAIFIVGLAFRVIILRRRHLVGFYDGGHKDLAKALRVHGNAIEYVPLALILFACAESQATASWILHSFGCLLVVGRVLHASGLYKTSGISFGRLVGTVSTMIVFIVLSLINILHLV